MEERKFDWHAHERDILGWFVLEATSTAAKDAFERPDFDPSSIDVKMMINGVEVDWQKVVLWWASQMDGQVAEKAREIVHDKMNGLMRSMSELGERIDATCPWKWE